MCCLCVDINECERNPCGHGVCNNVFGSFTCTCDTGYHISDNGDCVGKLLSMKCSCYDFFPYNATGTNGSKSLIACGRQMLYDFIQERI